ncbi:PorT family protein [Hymenobacter aquaticus]|uniref:PorT family protein n=1 Tax=Hymenobacter aquaticus TaxID=1867101 RepID=A0A4Z0PYD0_9BACT|nr:porin family protein [Hymenobacter aquaticus]TGE22256.1 PorT family protein [Hymenobacter aquaticus]
MPRFLRLLTLPLLAISFGALAQADFRPGYVVQPAGDTLRGEVDNRSDVRNAAACRFRQAGSVREYAPAELLGFGLTGRKVYRTRTVTVPDSAAQPARTYFLEVLAAGPAQLYYRRDPGGIDHYYISVGGQTATELVYRRVLLQMAGGEWVTMVSRYQEKNLFRGTLAETFAACPAVQQQVSSLQYKASSLVGIVERYNACVGGPGAGQPVSARRSARYSLGVVAGVGVSQMQLSGYTSFEQANFPSSVQPVVGLRLGIPMPRLNEKLSLQIEALYQRQRYESEYTTRFGSSSAYREQARVALNYLKVPFMLRYTYPRGAVRPMVQLGVSPNLSLSTTAEFRQQNLDGSYGTWRPAFDKEALSLFDWGPTASVGVLTSGLGGRQLTLEARAERSTGFVYISAINSELWHYQLLLGVNLTK